MKGGLQIMLWTGLKRKNDNKWELVLVDGLDIVCRSGMVSRHHLVITQMASYMNEGLKGNLTTDICMDLNYLKERN